MKNSTNNQDRHRWNARRGLATQVKKFDNIEAWNFGDDSLAFVRTCGCIYIHEFKNLSEPVEYTAAPSFRNIGHHLLEHGEQIRLLWLTKHQDIILHIWRKGTNRFILRRVMHGKEKNMVDLTGLSPLLSPYFMTVGYDGVLYLFNYETLVFEKFCLRTRSVQLRTPIQDLSLFHRGQGLGSAGQPKLSDNNQFIAHSDHCGHIRIFSTHTGEMVRQLDSCPALERLIFSSSDSGCWAPGKCSNSELPYAQDQSWVYWDLDDCQERPRSWRTTPSGICYAENQTYRTLYLRREMGIYAASESALRAVEMPNAGDGGPLVPQAEDDSVLGSSLRMSGDYLIEAVRRGSGNRTWQEVTVIDFSPSSEQAML